MSGFRLLALTGAIAIALNGCVTTQSGSTIATDGDEPIPRLTAAAAPGARPDLKSDEAGLRMMYDKAEAGMQTSGALIRDPELNQYISDLVCKLAKEYCAEIRVYIIRAPYFNATMGPNGAMQVWSGLLLRVRNEAQLATVLSHEIGHYLKRHSVERMRNVVATSNGLAFFQLAMAGAGVGFIGAVGQLVAMAELTAYNRDQEREADLFGHQFLVEHEYDPYQAAKIWENLREEQKADGDDDSKSLFLASHPLPNERRETLDKLAQRTDASVINWETGQDRYNAALRKHRKTYLQDELQLRRFDRFEALLEMLLKDGVNTGELRFFLGEIHRLRNEGSDMETAQRHYEQALKDGGAPAEIYRSMGQVHQKSGMPAKAKASYKRYLELAPNSTDAKMIEHLMRTMS